jgi:hypothetical protein
MEELPIYKITIDEEYAEGNELGIEQIAFTDNPAIMVKGVAFSSQTKPMVFKDSAKMRIAAPALIPMQIYRREEDGNEYYVEFTEEEVERIYSKFMRDLTNKGKFNLEHDQNEEVPAYILEAWIVDNPKEDKAYTRFGIEVPKGSVFIVSQVTNEEYYNKLVESGAVGYSIEGFLGMKLNQKQNTMEQKLSLPDGVHTIGNKIYHIAMGEVEKIEDIEAEEEEVEVVVEEEVKAEEEVKEEEMQEEEEEEEKTVEEKRDEEQAFEVDEAAIMAIVQPKLDELYEAIAAIKAEFLDRKEEAEEANDNLELSAVQIKMNALDSISKLYNNNK